MTNDRLVQTIAGTMAEAEKQGFSYPLHVVIELADGRRLTRMVYTDRTVTPIAGPHLLPASVEVREWDEATGKPKEGLVLRTEIEPDYYRRLE
jgi:hypothetical protein